MSDYPEVGTRLDLPPADEHEGEVYRVTEVRWDVQWETKKLGLWQSDGIQWNPIQNVMTFETICVPPSGYCEVINLYVNPDTNKLVVEFDDTPVE